MVYTDALESEEGVLERSVQVPGRRVMGSKGNGVIGECQLPAGSRLRMQSGTMVGPWKCHEFLCEL